MENKKKIENKMDISELVDGRGIYAIMHLESSKVYIGQSVEIRKRILKHINHLRKGVHINPKLQRAYDKYGASAFKAITLEITNINPLWEREIFWATKYDSFKHGYNIGGMKGANIPWHITDKQIAKNKSYKLNRETAKEICLLLNKQVPVSIISKKYSVSVKTVYNILLRRKWAHVSDEILNKNIKYDNPRKFSAEDIIKICHMLNNNVSSKEIQEIFNVNAVTIHNIKFGKTWGNITQEILKIKKRVNKQLSEKEVIEICELINTGLAACRIAQKYGVTGSCVENIKNGKSWVKVSKSILKENNIIKRKRLTKDEVIAICHLLNQKESPNKISKIYNIDISAIYNIKNGKAWIGISKDILNIERTTTSNRMIPEPLKISL